MIEAVKAKLPMAALMKAMSCDGFSDKQIEVATGDYCRMLVLLAEAGGTLRPTKLGDEMLHRHIEMPGFDEDCMNIIGSKIVHTPHKDETPELTATWQNTRLLSLAKFGIDPEFAGNDNELGAATGGGPVKAAICNVSVSNAAICNVSVSNAAICNVCAADQAA